MELYGWEEDMEKLWMTHFNRSLLSSGVITQEEYRQVEAAISRADSLNHRNRHSIMDKS